MALRERSTARIAWALLSAVVIVVAGAVFLRNPTIEPKPAAAQSFPVVDRSALTPPQLAVIDVVRAQFDAQPAATTFSDGVDEPWCADFVSWVMREVGMPFENPNSGSWRIPGVYTLQEYFQAAGRFEPPGYLPEPGDVVLYGESSGLGLHTNVVVGTDGPTVTTVGGNEGGIRVHTFATGPDTGLLGYGRLT